MSYKIYIPTKGRAGNLYLNRLVEVLKVKPILVVEPQELDEYNKIYTNKVYYEVLTKNNQGYNYLVDKLYKQISALSQNAFIIDDDICNIYLKIKGEKRLNIGIESISKALDFISINTPYALTGSVFKQHQWLCETDFQDFGRPSAFVYIKGSELTPDILKFFHKYDIIKYRLKADIMFASAILYNGLKVGMCGRYGFTTPDMAKSKGGCFDDYQTDQQALCSKEIFNIVGSKFSAILERRGRVEVRVHWKKLYEAKCKTKQNKLI